MDIRIKVILFLVLATILTQFPFIGKYFAVVNTLIHEVGHQIGSLITFGKPHRISLFSNTEGLALSSHRFWIGRVITALSGYMFSSFTAFLFFYLVYKNRIDIVIWILLAIFMISFLFWIRNLYGLFWVLTFGASFVWLLLHTTPTLKENMVLFLIAIVFVESFTSAFEIMIISFKSPTTAGDATSLSKLTFIIPAQLWGSFFFIQSLYFSWKSLKWFFPILNITRL